MHEYYIVRCTNSLLRHMDNEQCGQLSLDIQGEKSGAFTLEAENFQFSFEMTLGDETQSGICVMTEDRRVDVDSFSAVFGTLIVHGNDDSFAMVKKDILEEESMRLRSRAKAGPVSARDNRQQPRRKRQKRSRQRMAESPTPVSMPPPPSASLSRGEPAAKKRRADKREVPMPGNRDKRLLQEFETLYEQYGELGRERADLEFEFEQALLQEDAEALRSCHCSVLAFVARVTGPILRNYKRLVHISSLLAGSAVIADTADGVPVLGC